MKITGDIPDIVDKQTGQELFQLGIQEISQIDANDLFTNFIFPYQQKINAYIILFNQSVEDFGRINRILKKMKQSLNVQKELRSKNIVLSEIRYTNHKKATEKMKTVMAMGHSLLLEIREQITQQQINTKFMIDIEGKVYLVDESKIKDLSLVLSSFGAGTISNPFSLAYQLDASIENFLKTLVQQNEAEIISDDDIWKTIWIRKIDYLQQKSIKNKKKYIPFYNSKDAEIYMLYKGNPPGGGEDLATLTVDRYAQLRASLGGGGGYASPFYKVGDIGLTQVKYFKIHYDEQETAVNYTRFSLLRDKFKQLSSIFNQNNIENIGQDLLEFFTEKEKNISEKITQKVNEEAKQNIRKYFGLQ